MTPPSEALGPRASMLLGLLGRPMTVRELYELVQKARAVAEKIDRALLPEGDRLLDAGNAALADIDAGGTALVRRLLERLERFDLVRRQPGLTPGDTQLWWRP